MRLGQARCPRRYEHKERDLLFCLCLSAVSPPHFRRPPAFSKCLEVARSGLTHPACRPHFRRPPALSERLRWLVQDKHGVPKNGASTFFPHRKESSKESMPRWIKLMRRAGKSGKGITPPYGRRTNAFSTDFPEVKKRFKKRGKKKGKEKQIFIKAVLYFTRLYAELKLFLRIQNIFPAKHQKRRLSERSELRRFRFAPYIVQPCQ